MERLAMLDKATAVGYKQVYNGLWTARFTLPADDPKNQHCKKFNYVEIFDGKRRVELFRIVKNTFTRAGARGLINYKCEHVITTLLDNVLFKFHQIGNIGVFTPEVINYILRHQTIQNWRLGRCDFRHQFLYKWESSNLLFSLFDVPKPFMGEWHFTYDTTVYPWIVNLVRAETEIGCELRRRKNMQGVTKEEDAKSLVTRLYPLGYGEGDNQLTIRNVNNGVEYLDADTISLWGVKESIWPDRRFEDAENLMATAKKMLERLKMPFISYTVESIDLFQRTRQDFDEFREGKVVRVIDREDGIDLDTRIMEIDKPDVTKADISVVIANKDRNVAGSIAALRERARINDTYAQGAETLIMMTFADNAEPGFPAVFEFFTPAGMVNVNEALLRVRLEPYRAFSRAIRGGGGTTQTSTSGGGTTATSTSGGATTQVTTQQATQTPTTSQEAQRTPTTSSEPQRVPSTTVEPQRATMSLTESWRNTDSANVPETGGGSHRHSIPWLHVHNIPAHSHTVTIPAHQHSVTIPAHNHTVTIPAHSHSVTIPSHQHQVTISAHNHNITIHDHTHAIDFGIFQGERADSIGIRVDGNTVPITADLNHINIIPFLRRDGGGRVVRNAWHRLEIVPNRQTRISGAVFLNIFTNSRGGENA